MFREFIIFAKMCAYVRVRLFEPTVPVAIGQLVQVRILDAHPQILVGELA